MAYVSDSNLTQFWGLAKDYIKAEDGRFANWQKTEKAGAVTCWPVGGTQLLPTVDFMFTETPPASGDKGPENPSTISSASQVKVGRIGKNLLLAVPDNTSWYGISITRQPNGSYLLNGTSTSAQQRYFPLTDCGEFAAGPYSILKLDTTKKYTLSARVASGTITGGVSLTAGSTVAQNWIASSAMQLINGEINTATRGAAALVTGEFICRLNVNAGTSFNNVVLQVQLEEGSIATDFEPPMLSADANHDLPFGSTFYGGTLDVASGVMTVTHVTVTPDASTVDISSAPAALPLDYADTYGRTITSADGTSLSIGSTGGTVVYKLATPQIIQLTPTQILSLAQQDKYTPRLNTVYTDASSIQVGYAKSPIRSEYELTQAIIATEGGE